MTRIASVLLASFLASVTASFLTFAAGHTAGVRYIPLEGHTHVAHAGGVDCLDSDPDTCFFPGTMTKDHTRTAALRVRHRHVGSERDVEQDTTDTWLITMTWKTISTSDPCPCDEHVVTATVAIVWNGSSFTPNCTGCNPWSGPLYGVQVCGGPECGSKASEYLLLLDIEDTDDSICIFPAFLHSVGFESLHLDDGDVFTRSPCTEILGVSPVNEPYMAVDSTFRCEYSCTHANLDNTIPIVTIYFQ